MPMGYLLRGGNRRAASVAAFGVLACPSAALAAPPELLATYSVDGAPASSVLVPGIDGGTSVSYNATINAPNGDWSITYSITADLEPDPSASLLGHITVVNQSAVPKNFACSFTVNLCPVIEGGSFIGGTTLLSLTTQGPGSLTCVDSTPIVDVLTDGVPSAALFPCPFALATTGSGSLSSPAIFGLPGPSQRGPEHFFSVGVGKQVALTSLDTSKIQFTILFKDANGAGVPACMGDVNGDGQVNSADITYILTQWGSAPPCGSYSADLDGSGSIDAGDLALLLTFWGSCS